MKREQGPLPVNGYLGRTGARGIPTHRHALRAGLHEAAHSVYLSGRFFQHRGQVAVRGTVGDRLHPSGAGRAIPCGVHDIARNEGKWRSGDPRLSGNGVAVLWRYVAARCADSLA